MNVKVHTMVGGPHDGVEFPVEVDESTGNCPIIVYWQGRELVHHDGAHRYQWSEEIRREYLDED